MGSKLRQPKNGLINGKELDSIDTNVICIIDKITQELIVYIKDREYINRGQKIL